jgi:hypothetical protein
MTRAHTSPGCLRWTRWVRLLSAGVVSGGGRTDCEGCAIVRGLGVAYPPAMATFPVDDVVPAAQALPTSAVGELWPDAIVIGGDAELAVLEPDGVHPLLSAVSQAFAEHRPLVLSPDAVWLTIAQGVAQHVRLHAETLRPRLVGHAGRKRLEVVVDGAMPRDEDAWRHVVDSLAKQLAGEVNDAALFECDFSTSGQVEQIAGRVVLLDVYAPYFSYWLRCVCGIPSVTLTGTVADWERIRARVDGLAAFGMDAWCRSLVPITEEFVRAVAGTPNTPFWRRIYNPADAYGGEVITGWVARLYPYLHGFAGLDQPNPLLELPIDEPRELTVGRMGYNGPGIRSDAVPAMLSRVVVTVNDVVAGDNAVVALHAGLVGVCQDANGALRPVAGWYLAPAQVEIHDVIDRMVREHRTTAPQPGHLAHATAELVALHDRIGGATLFDGAWRLLPVAEHGMVPRGYGKPHLITVMRIPDGRHLGAAVDLTSETMHWMACHVEDLGTDRPGLVAGRRQRLLDEPAGVPLYGTSLALILQAILDGHDLSHLETGRLADLEAADPPELPGPPADTRTPAQAPGHHVPPPGANAGLDEIRAAKEAAIDRDDFDQAARLRDREKSLLRELANRQQTNRTEI